MIQLSEISQFRLDINKMSKIKPDERYTFSFVYHNTFDNNINDLSKVIDFLHEDLVWDGIPTLDIVKQRLNFGSICMFWKYNNNVVGWSWLNNNNITTDWVTSHKPLNSNEQYGGGAFLHRKSKPEPLAGYKFYRLGIENMFESFDKSILYLYSDTWNRASSILCNRVGFNKYNFL